jgi:glycosyltransferase involved in cell wall biosynthesis
VWWSSTFDHFRKKHLFPNDETVKINSHLTLKLLHGCGYQRNLSVTRIWDHWLLAKKFLKAAQNEQPPDVIISSFPTIELSLAAVDYGHTRQVPVVVDMRDMWPDIFIDSVGKLLKPLVKLFTIPMFRQARRVCSNAAAITGITEAYVEWGLQRGNRRRSDYDRAFPLGYVDKHPASDAIAEAEKFWDNNGVSSKNCDFIVCYVGTIARWADLTTVIQTARRLNKIGKRMLFVLCGTGDRLEHYQEITNGDPSILLPGWVDAAQIYVLMRRASVGLDPLPERYDFLATINNKAVEYLSAGLPVISSPDHGVLSALLKGYQCGESYPHGNPDTLVDLLVRLDDDREKLRMMSQNALRLFQERFTAEKVYTEMMEHLVKIAENAKQNQAIGSATLKCEARG